MKLLDEIMEWAEALFMVLALILAIWVFVVAVQKSREEIKQERQEQSQQYHPRFDYYDLWFLQKEA